MSRLKGAAGLTAAGLLAVTLIGNWEGIRLYVYKDVIGVYTYCIGETKDAKTKLGLKFTKEQCRSLLIERLIGDYEKGMRRCLKAPDALPDKSYVAFLSLTYNIGVSGFCTSSVPRLINAGDLRGACDRLLVFNKAGGKVVKGLVNRRKAERKLCLEGLAARAAAAPAGGGRSPARKGPSPC